MASTTPYPINQIPPYFTYNPFPANTTVSFIPIAAPYITPWWTSVIGGSISFLIAVHNFLTLLSPQVVLAPQEEKGEGQIPRKMGPTRRSLIVSFLGLCFTFVQSVSGLVHLAGMSAHLDRVQPPSGGLFLTIFAAIGSLVNTTVRSSVWLSLIAAVNAVLAMLHVGLLVFLPSIGTAKLWQVSSNACITYVTDVGNNTSVGNNSANAGNFWLGLETFGAGWQGAPANNFDVSCIPNSNGTALGFGLPPNSSADNANIYKIATGVYIWVAIFYSVGIFFLQRNDWKMTKGDYTQVNSRGKLVVKKTASYLLTLYGTAPQLLFLIGLAGFTWALAFNYDKKPFNAIVTVCPQIPASSTVNITTDMQRQCLNAGFSEKLPGLAEGVKLGGFLEFLRLLSNL
jgi:hypothetical protein